MQSECNMHCMKAFTDCEHCGRLQSHCLTHQTNQLCTCDPYGEAEYWAKMEAEYAAV